jgi:nucleotide-binding universal stress UspA family protein
VSRVVVPVRYPLTEHSRETLSEAISIAADDGADLTVIHVNLFQQGQEVSQRELKRAVEQDVGRLENARYVVRRGFVVEETLLEEIAAEDADIVVIGEAQTARWRQMIRRLVDEPDVETYLSEHLDCRLVTVGTE